MKHLFTLVITVCFFLQTNLIACSLEDGHRFFPENDLSFPVTEKGITKISYWEFVFLLNKIEKLFADDVKNDGAKLKIYTDWDEPGVNAYASRTKPGEYSVHIWGGLARHPLMTLDALAMIACHEIGHHLGGFPRKFGEEWGAAEGQADYWAANKCFKKLIQNDNNSSVNAKVKIDNEIKTQCNNFYLQDGDIQSCIRNSTAGGVLSLVLNSLRTGNAPVSFTTPDKKQTGVTNDEHPDAQCRLDTYFAGALCGLDWKTPVGFKFNDVDTGSCTTKQGHAYKASRPLCWFNPKDYVKSYL